MGRWVIGVLLILSLGRYLVAAWYAHPFGDDFSYAVAGMRTELLPRLWDEYNLWNGRWASNPFILRGPLVLGIDRGLWLYRAVPCLLLFLGLLAGRSLSKALLPALSRADAWLAGGCLLTLALQGMPDPGEGVYWFTGAITYFLPASLTWFLLANWIRIWGNGWSISVTKAVALGSLALFISGFNELHMVFMLLLHIGLLWLVRANARGTLARAMIPMGMVLVGAAVMVLAPGNSARGAQFALSHEVGRTLLGGVAQTVRFGMLWSLSPILLSAVFLAVGHAAWLRRSSSWLEDARMPRPLALVGMILCFSFIAMALPYWATGLLGQHRTVNATWLFVLPFAVLLLLVQLHRFGPPAMPAGLRNAALFILLAGILFTGTSGALTRDLASGRMRRFDSRLNERYEVLSETAARGVAQVDLEPLVDSPTTFHFLDAGTDASNWVNRSLALYFGADSTNVVVRQP